MNMDKILKNMSNLHQISARNPTLYGSFWFVLPQHKCPSATRIFKNHKGRPIKAIFRHKQVISEVWNDFHLFFQNSHFWCIFSSQMIFFGQEGIPFYSPCPETIKEAQIIHFKNILSKILVMYKRLFVVSWKSHKNRVTRSHHYHRCYHKNLREKHYRDQKFNCINLKIFVFNFKEYLTSNFNYNFWNCFKLIL